MVGAVNNRKGYKCFLMTKIRFLIMYQLLTRRPRSRFMLNGTVTIGKKIWPLPGFMGETQTPYRIHMAQRCAVFGTVAERGGLPCTWANIR